MALFTLPGFMVYVVKAAISIVIVSFCTCFVKKLIFTCTPVTKLVYDYCTRISPSKKKQKISLYK